MTGRFQTGCSAPAAWFLSGKWRAYIPETVRNPGSNEYPVSHLRQICYVWIGNVVRDLSFKYLRGCLKDGIPFYCICFSFVKMQESESSTLSDAEKRCNSLIFC